MMWKCKPAHVFIYPASLCLLVGAFNPFTFKVIINMYDPITIFLILGGCLFSVGIFFIVLGFFSLFFVSYLEKLVPLAFVVKLLSVQFC